MFVEILFLVVEGMLFGALAGGVAGVTARALLGWGGGPFSSPESMGLVALFLGFYGAVAGSFIGAGIAVWRGAPERWRAYRAGSVAGMLLGFAVSLIWQVMARRHGAYAFDALGASAILAPAGSIVLGVLNAARPARHSR